MPEPALRASCSAPGGATYAETTKAPAHAGTTGVALQGRVRDIEGSGCDAFGQETDWADQVIDLSR